MADQFQLVTVSAASPNWSNPVVLSPLGNEHVMLYNKNASAVVEYSFDGGTTVHGNLDPADGTRGKTFDNRKVSSICFRIATGSTGPAVVSVESWAGGGA